MPNGQGNVEESSGRIGIEPSPDRPDLTDFREDSAAGCRFSCILEGDAISRTQEGT